MWEQFQEHGRNDLTAALQQLNGVASLHFTTVDSEVPEAPLSGPRSFTAMSEGAKICL